jgi:hypothetical protein
LVTRGQVASIAVKAARSSRSRTAGRDAVGGEDHDRAVGDLVDGLDETARARAEAADDVLVVDDLVVDVDRVIGEHVQHLVHDLNGHLDAGAESPRVGEKQTHLG